jgi:hypothetical protein
MPRPVLPLAACLAALAGAAAAQEAADPAGPIPQITEATGEAFALCREAGGTPQLTEDYVRVAGLNDDGVEDYLVDAFGFYCDRAASVLCGSAGCPVNVWLSGPEGHAAAWSGMAQTSRIADGAVLLELHGSQCEPPKVGAEGCEVRLTFAAAEPATTAEPVGDATGPAPRPAGPTSDPAAGPASDAPVGGWSLRAVPDGDPVAVSDGPGRLERVAVFCLSGQPWLALTLSPRPRAETAAVGFAFSDAKVEAEARF